MDKNVSSVSLIIQDILSYSLNYLLNFHDYMIYHNSSIDIASRFQFSILSEKQRERVNLGAKIRIELTIGFNFNRLEQRRRGREWKEICLDRARLIKYRLKLAVYRIHSRGHGLCHRGSSSLINSQRVEQLLLL